MSGPITWQNVNGASLSEASRPLEIAGRTMNSAFDNFRGVLTDQQAVDSANWNQGKINNTNTALNQINQYANPEEFAAAQKSGAIQALLAANGAQIDQQAVRAAADGRLGVLQGRAEQDIRYQNTSRDQAEAGIRDEIMSKINSGNPALIAEGQAQLAQVKLRQEADIALAGNNAQQQQVTRGRDTAKFNQDTEKHKADLVHMVNQDRIAQGNLALNGRQVAVAEARQKQEASEFNLKREEYAQKVRDGKFEQLGKLKTSTIDTKEGLEEAVNMIGTLYKDNPQMRSSLTNLVGDLSRERFTLKDGKGNPITGPDGKAQTIGLSVAQVLAGVASAKDDRNFVGRMLNNKSTAGADIKDTIIKSMDSPDAQQAALQSYAMRQRLLNDIAKSIDKDGKSEKGKSDSGASGGGSDSSSPASTSKPPEMKPFTKEEFVSKVPPRDYAAEPEGMTFDQAAAWNADRNKPVNIPASGARVAPKSAEESKARASEEAFKVKMAADFARNNPKPAPPSAAEMKAKREQELRELDAVLARGRLAGSNK